MPIVTGHYILHQTNLPKKVDTLYARFVSQLVNGKKTVLVLYPDWEPGFESSYGRYAVRIALAPGDGTVAKGLAPGDGTVAKGLAQIVVTGRRIIGMITDGSVSQLVLKEAVSMSSVYAFAFDLKDCGPLEIQKNWRGKPVSVRIMAKEGQASVFGLQVLDVFFVVKDNGQVLSTTLPAFLDQLTRSVP